MFRFQNLPNQDNTGRVATYSQQELTFASTINISSNFYSSLFFLNATNNCTINFAAPSYIGDTIEFIVKGFSDPNATLTGTGYFVGDLGRVGLNETLIVKLMSDGTNWVVIPNV
jgi:hypothetical protein